MKKKQTVCLLNDSFPPLIDGVANAVMNYAAVLPNKGFDSMVVTPGHPKAEDNAFSYPVVRYPSIASQKFEGYPAGIPFSPKLAEGLTHKKVALLHTHCPIMSTFMARQLRQLCHAPIVFTYHTKFDVDIAHIIKNETLQQAAKKALVANIFACDEVWAVSQGAGENLRSLGYKGKYIVMPNGVDMPCEKATPELIAKATNDYDLPQDVPVYLFVGRIMWYKGLRIIADALARQLARGKDFRMVFIGDGECREEFEAYVKKCGIASKCIFTGVIRNRDILRGWYSRADLFLFPSTFDTNGLVVREAASCQLPAVLIQNSCAAEGVIDGQNGFLIQEKAEALDACLSALTKEKLATVGKAASRELYLSWDTAVGYATERYKQVIANYKTGAYHHRATAMEGIMKANGELMGALGKLSASLHKRHD